MTKDRLLRSIVPSVPVLARIPGFGWALDFADGRIKRRHPEWADLPPASLRMRIGVGNHLLRNHAGFAAAGSEIVTELAQKGYLTPDGSVLELGCGCGRNAVAFAAFLDAEGSYAGQDVDREMIEWCQRNLQTTRVRFFHADVFSKVYNPKGRPAREIRLPVDDASTSIIVSVSVFSHLLEDDALHYIEEAARVLRPGGHLHMTLFVMDLMRDRLGDRWKFEHQLGRCYVDSLRYPEAAVAFDLSTLREMFAANGLETVEVYHETRHQQTVVARKL